MIVSADIHLREESAETVFGQVLPGLGAAAVQDPDKVLAILGDFWHVRYRVSVALQNKAWEWLRGLGRQGVHVILLPGNHDQINPAGENALQVFGSLSSVSVYSEPICDVYGYWIPYRKDVEAVRVAIAQGAEMSSRTPILWMHHGFQGAEVNNGRVGTDGLDPSGFISWEKVLCGHYHKRQIVGNVHYVGSPYQVSAGEVGQPGGYLYWDPRARTATWFNCEWGKSYIKIRVDDLDSLDVSQCQSDDQLRVTTAPGVDPLAVAAKLTALGFADRVITPEQSATEARLGLSGTATASEYVDAYVEKCRGDLDSEELLAMFRTFVEGVAP